MLPPSRPIRLPPPSIPCHVIIDHHPLGHLSPLQLSPLSHRELVRSDIVALGNLVITKWFGKYPHHLQLFPFRDAPDLTTDARSVAHGKSVLSAVGAVVAGMRDVDALSSTIDHLAAVHMSKGVHRDMFPALGWAIMSVLADRLGAEWTDEVRGAWETVFERLTTRINDAMDQYIAAAEEERLHPENKMEPVQEDNSEEPVPQSKFGALRGRRQARGRRSRLPHPRRQPASL